MVEEESECRYIHKDELEVETLFEKGRNRGAILGVGNRERDDTAKKMKTKREM